MGVMYKDVKTIVISHLVIFGEIIVGTVRGCLLVMGFRSCENGGGIKCECISPIL